MSKRLITQTNFTGGELAPSMYGRIDTSRFLNGTARSINVGIEPQGGLFFRRGSKHSTEVKDSSKFTILHEFEYNENEVYMLEVGDQYIRILKNRVPLLYTTGPDIGDPVEIATPYLEAELTDLYFGQSGDFLYIVHKNHQTREFTRVDENTWTLNLFENKDGPYLDQSESDEEVTLSLSSILNRATLTSTDASDFSGVSVGEFVEYYDGKFLVIGEVITKTSNQELIIEPKENVIDVTSIEKTAVINYAASNADFPNRLQSTVSIWSSETENTYIKVDTAWYLLGDNITENEEITGTGTKQDYGADVIEVDSTITFHTPTGDVALTNHTITATLKSSQALFSSSRDVNRSVRLDFSSEKVWAKITAYTSTTQVSVDLGRMMPFNPSKPDEFLNDAKTRVWQWGAWYTGNWPSAMTFDNDRTLFANTILEPLKYWYSVTEDYNNFAPTNTKSEVLDDSAITRQLNSEKINDIVWLNTGPVLLIGTIGSEFQVKPSALSEPLSPTNIRTTSQVTHGSADKIPPERIGTQVLFMQKGRNKLRSMQYDFEIDQFKANDLTIFAEHIFKQQGGVTSFAHRQEPISELWFTTSDGNPVICTYEHEHNVNAFGNIKMGGSFNNGDAVVEWLDVLTGPDDDEVYMIVKRTVNGATKRYIEVITGDFTAHSSIKDDPETLTEAQIQQLNYMDSHVTYYQGDTGVVAKLQIAFIIDDTSSMADDITTVKNAIADINTALASKFTSIEYAIVRFKDEDNTTVLQDFTDLATFQTQLATISASGGDDTEENGYGAIVTAANTLTWDTTGVVSKQAVLFSDAASHTRGATQSQAITRCTEKNIYFSYGLTSESTYQAVADATGGALITETGDFADNFADQVLKQARPPTNTIPGFTHLVGETVTILADGTLRGDYVVPANGEVTFTGPIASNVIGGLKYIGDVIVLPIFTESQQGSTIGRKKQIQQLTFRVIDTFYIKFGAVGKELQKHEFRRLDNPMGAIAFPSTRDYTKKIDSSFEEEAKYRIYHDVPYPLRIASVTAHLEISD